MSLSRDQETVRRLDLLTTDYINGLEATYILRHTGKPRHRYPPLYPLLFDRPSKMVHKVLFWAGFGMAPSSLAQLQLHQEHS